MVLPSLFFGAALLAALSGVPGLWAHRAGGRIATWALAAAALCALVVAGATLYGGRGWEVDLPWALPGARFHFRGDALGALVLVPAGLVPALLSWYGSGYWTDAEQGRSARRLRLFFGACAGAMILVTAAANALPFLFAWEAMALAGFLLITASHRDAAVREGGWIYFVATHVGTLCLFAGFALLARARGTFDLGPLPAGFAASPSGTAVFLLLLVGFGLKAGVLPFHVWLPPAHASAPSHVSALLSGIMLKMGILGLLRLASWVPDPPVWWGGLLAGMGALSGILALAMALAQRDLKRMLAYSSIENVSIIFMGLGMALAGKALGLGALAVLGGAGALFHLLNHALFKPLLFMGAGSVMHATGTRDMERLGGLARRMPGTALLFLAGSAAICGLPPLNGFAGEFLIYLGALGALAPGGWPWAAVVLVALAAIGALAVACFTRAFGIVFLGEPRTESGAGAHEAPPAMIRSMSVLAGLCVAIGVAPLALVPALERAAQELGGTQRLRDLAHLGPLTLVAAVGILAAAAVWERLRRTPYTVQDTWGCGYGAPTPRIQYTATSFSQMLTGAFRWVLRPTDRRPRLQGLFPRPVLFRSRESDLLLDRAVRPSMGLSARVLSRLRILQGGLLPVYLVYIVLTLVALFAWTLS
jgi:hydrogenase-4 component B